jgi:hypothetical protein
MEGRTLEQNKKLYTLLNLLNIDMELKQELVLQFTNQRTNSSKEMNIDECAKMISYLERISGNTTERERVTLMKMRFGLYYSLRDKGYLPSLDNKEVMQHLDAFCIKCWNTPASNMNEKKLGAILGIVRRWDNKKRYAQNQ